MLTARLCGPKPALTSEMFQNRIPGLTEHQGILDARLDSMPSNQQSPAR